MVPHLTTALTGPLFEIESRFLQAAPDDRAPILEQVTGTEIYSLISIRVHERRSEERKKLETLLSELAAVSVSAVVAACLAL